MARFSKIMIVLAVSLCGLLAQAAAPGCHYLNAKQAAKAVELSNIAIGHGANFLIYSKNESGILRPLGVWSEVRRDKKHHSNVSVIRIDDREVDISLIYVASNASSRTAYNLAWMSGCRPGPQQPLKIPNY